MRRVAVMLMVGISLGWVGSVESAQPTADQPVLKPAEAVSLADFDNPFSEHADGTRLWTDSTGSHRVEARFVSATRDTVRLQRPDKRFVRVKLSQLSMADRQLVRDLLRTLAAK